MAAVQGSEMFQPGYLGPADKEAKELKKTYDDVDKIILKINADSKALAKTLSAGTGIENFKKLNEVFKETNKTRKAAITIDEEKIKLNEKLKRLRSDAIQQNVELKLLIQEQTKVNKELAKETLGLTNAYDKLVKKTDKAQKNFKKLAAEFGVNSKQAKKAKTEFDKLDKELREINQDAKDGRRDVGRYGDAIKSTVGSLKNFAGALGIVGGIQLFTRGIKDAFDISVNFEKAIASLSAITGATGETLEQFKSNVISVAETTKKSAVEVAKAFELVGSAKPELLADADALAAVTEQAIILSQATGLDLDVSAKALTNTLNQFNLGAEESARLINILAAGSQAGAAPVNEINDAMAKFGTVAAAVKIGVEESVAAIELLAEKSIVGAEAGTKLRNVITTLSVIDALPEAAQEQLEKYGVDTSIVSDTTLTFAERLTELSKISEDQTALFKVFGKENLVAGQILLQNVDALEGYTDAVTGTSTATEQAATNQDTLSAIIQQLKAAWESIVIKFSEGSGVLDGLKVVLKFVANNLETIVNIVLLLIKAFVAYKAAVLIATTATKIYNAAMAKSTKGFKSFVKAVKLNPWGLIAAGLAVVLPALIDFVSELFDASKQMTAFEEATELANNEIIKERAGLEAVFEQLKRSNPESQRRLDLIVEINKKYGTTLENLEDEEEFVTQVTDAYQKLNEELEARIRNQVLQEGLADLIREEVRLEGALRQAVTGKTITDKELRGAVSVAGVDFLIKNIEEIRKQKEEFFKGLADLSKDQEVPVPEIITEEDVEDQEANAKKSVRIEDERLKRLKALREVNAIALLALENKLKADEVDDELIADRVLQQRIQLAKRELALVKELFGKSSEEFIEEKNKFDDLVDNNQTERLDKRKTEIIAHNTELIKVQKSFAQEQIELLAKLEAERIAKENKAREKALKELRAFAKTNIKIFQSITDGFNQSVENRIEKEQTEIEASQTRIDKLEEAAKAGSLEATESIKAEEERQAASQLEIERLEKKKRNLLAITVGLKALEAAIDGGDKNAFANVGANLATFLGNIPKFIEGTGSGTIADALGRPNLSGQDGYVIRADGKEKILNPEQAAMTGGLSADQIAYGAMMYHNNKGLIRGAVNKASVKEGFGSDDIVKAIKDQVFPVSEVDYDKLNQIVTNTVKRQNKVEITRKRTGGAFS